MSQSEILFVTRIYKNRLRGRGSARLIADLARTCQSIAIDDEAGNAWSVDNGYAGYTSYASLDDLVWRDPAFSDLKVHLDQHAMIFAGELDLDLSGRPLELDNIWINVLAPGGTHSGHIHPNCVLSGTFYVDVPDGASAIRFEDPRLGMMMSAPPRKARASREHKPFIAITPTAGTVLIWESWLRHEVPINQADHERISISFNYRWG